MLNSPSASHSLEFAPLYPALKHWNFSRQLVYIDLSGLGLKHLPECVGFLSELTVLMVSNNRLLSLPCSLGSLSGLRSLNVAQNNLKTLPANLAAAPLVRLDTDGDLCTHGNPIEVLSSAFLGTRLGPQCEALQIKYTSPQHADFHAEALELEQRQTQLEAERQALSDSTQGRTNLYCQRQFAFERWFQWFNVYGPGSLLVMMRCCQTWPTGLCLRLKLRLSRRVVSRVPPWKMLASNTSSKWLSTFT